MEDPRIILQLILIVFIRCDAVNPGCECLLYSATYGKEYGTFSSPDYPRPYPPSINCLLYTFVATKEEIVEITFKDFDVQKNHLDCMRGDYLKLFLHVDSGEVNEYTPWSGLLCGGYTDVPHVLYSSGPAMVLEFHTDHLVSNSTGFVGTFRFIDRRMFRNDGQKLSGTLCDHQFISSNHSLSHGRFYSPRYPSTYPKNIRCAYRFRARSKERIKILFEEVTLQKGDVSCLNRGDVIKVHDGRSGISPTISVLCNEASGLEVLSTGPDFYIEFVANSESPGQGFKAAFQFQPIDPEPSNDVQQTDTTKFISVETVGTSTQMHRQSTDPGPLVSATSDASTREETPSTAGDSGITSSAATADAQDDVDVDTHEATTTPFTPTPRHSRVVVCSQASSCDLSVDSDTVKNGTFTSPAYPNPYPPRSHCRYDFQGRGKERIQITFTDFHLYHPAEEAEECQIMDALMAYVLTDGRMEKIDDFCGSNVPKPIMSNGPRLMLEFRGIYSSRSVRGFKATYAFTENFGITTGQQLPDLPCAFSYNSSESRNGTFASPNFPGLYPRDTECHYFFHGQQHQRVRLHFNYFDVEGVSPCEATSASDYVEFSNFMARDRKYARYCGLLKEFDIESDRKFFRVTFRSNDRLDGTGFNGTYEFVDNVDTITPAKPTTGGSEAFYHTDQSRVIGGLLLLLLYSLC